MAFVHRPAGATQDKVNLCHHTGSETNPWVVQRVDSNEEQSHLDNGDFLYEGEYDIHTQDAKNWCSEHQVTPTPTDIPKDICENLDGNQESVPTNYVEEDGQCVCPQGFHTQGYGDNHLYEIPECVPNEEPSVTPTPTATPSSEPIFSGNPFEVGVPTCENGSTVQLPANPHVIRNGTQATVNFFITEGSEANIYYRVVGQNNWQFSVIGVKPNADHFVSYTINDLDANLGYDFSIQQTFGKCSGGQMVSVIVVDGPSSQTFRFSYWTWSN